MDVMETQLQTVHLDGTEDDMKIYHETKVSIKARGHYTICGLILIDFTSVHFWVKFYGIFFSSELP